MEEKRVRVVWTETAKKNLAKLPQAVRRGLLKKAALLRDCADPRSASKPLWGPLQGFYRITYSRYRAIYDVEEEQLASGDVFVTITVRFVAAGIRKEGDKKDVYRFAQRMLKLGGIDLEFDEDDLAEPEEDV